MHLLPSPEELVLERARCYAASRQSAGLVVLEGTALRVQLGPLLGISAISPDLLHMSTSAGGPFELLSPLCWWKGQICLFCWLVHVEIT